MRTTNEDLKNAIQAYYAMLDRVISSKEEEYIDAQIHKLKRELEKRGIYVREKTKPEFVKIK